MIVSCPSCNVRYRHEVVLATAVTARCSGCDATFELGRPRKAYRVVPRGSAAAVAIPAGGHFDLPQTVTQSMSETATASPRPALSAWAVALALLLAAVCTASGYYLSLLQITDTTTGTASGAGVGAVLAWAVIRWTTRAR